MSRNPIWKVDGHTVETDFDGRRWRYRIDGENWTAPTYADENEAMWYARKDIDAMPKPIVVLGDVNPIEHSGGVVYQEGDPPTYRLVYFEPYDAEDETERVYVYGFDIEPDVFADLTWASQKGLSSYSGLSEDELRELGTSDHVVDRAHVYIDVGQYEGFSNLDGQPQDLTVEEAQKQYGAAVDAAHEAWKRRPRDPRLPKKNPRDAVKERLLRY